MAINISLDQLAILASVLFVYVIYRLKGRNALPLPPGPKGYPLIGNLLDLPAEDQWVKFHEWCKVYGSDVIHLNLLGQDVIILDSKEAATDLMERRSSIYSDRPILPMINDLMGFDFNFGLIQYGDQWRSQRRMMHEVFHPKAALDLKPHSLKSTRDVLRRFLERPGDVVGNIRHMAGRTIMSIVYGLEVESDNDPYINTVEAAVRILADKIEPGDNLVNLFPMLKHLPEWMPGAGFHARARHARGIAHKMLEVPFRAAKSRLDKGSNYIPSFISHFYSRLDDHTLSDRQEWLIKGAAAAIYIGGSDTAGRFLDSDMLRMLGGSSDAASATGAVVQRAECEFSNPAGIFARR